MSHHVSISRSPLEVSKSHCGTVGSSHATLVVATDAKLAAYKRLGREAVTLLSGWVSGLVIWWMLWYFAPGSMQEVKTVGMIGLLRGMCWKKKGLFNYYRKRAHVTCRGMISSITV